MRGIDPFAHMKQLAARMSKLKSTREIEAELDEMEYLFEVIPPDFQDIAEELILQLREKLSDAESPPKHF